MKAALTLILAASLGACGGAPAPLNLGEFERDERPLADPRSDARAAVDAILRQDRLTLDDALRIADRLNPDLASERRAVDGAGAAIWEASLPPNPSVFVEVEEVRPDGGSLGSSERRAGLRVALPVAGRIGAAVSLAEKEREIAALIYLARRREILSEVKRAFVKHLAARRAVGLAREALALARRHHATAEERFKAETVPELELLKSAVQAAKADNELRRAERDLESTVRILHARIGSPELPNDRFEGTLQETYRSPALEALRGQVLSLHPLVRVAEKRREAAGLQLDLARALRFADAGLEFSAGRDPEDETIFEAGLSVPLPLFDRSQARIAEAEVRIQQADLRAQSVRNELILALTDAHRAFTAARDLAAVYREEILPKAQKALDQTLEGYAAGRFGILDVLDSQRTLAEARAAHAAALSDLNLSAIALEQLTGTALEPLR